MSHTETNKTQFVTSIGEVRAAVQQARQQGEKIGFVPTMGALHEGHLSLVDASLTECDRTVVSIFVNPTQFGPSEDLASYPRDLQKDVELLQERGCWLVFAPDVVDIYPPGHQTVVDVGSVAVPWEGACRPTHFRGVATVVLKLFQIVPADRAYFGQKDYQQTLVVNKLVDDLNVPIEVRVCPIIREPDGLALSSRNAYLNAEERERAAKLWQSLQLAEQLHAGGETDVLCIADEMERLITADEDDEDVEVQYIAFLEQSTVREVATISGPTVVALAVRVGKTRLLDNHVIG